MDRIVPGIIVTVFALLLLAAMVWAWRARTRRQAAFRRPTDAPAADARGSVLTQAQVLYVATTTAGDPLDRLTIPGLAFRGRGVITVLTLGISISIPGEPETFVKASQLRAVGTSTWAIDRVVETGGLVRLDWTYESGEGPVDVESYVRTTALGDANRLIEAANSLIPQAAHPADATPQQEGPSS